MPAEEDMAVVKTFVEEVINSGNLERVDELVAPDHVNNDPTAPDHAPGAEGIKDLIGRTAPASPTCTSRPGRCSPLTARSPTTGS